MTPNAIGAESPKPQPANWVDPLFTQPYVDNDEWRDTPIRHRHVHGGFKGTDCLFSFYFPPKEQYGGRFFQPVFAMPGSEKMVQVPPGQRDIFGHASLIGFAAASGAYLIESNQGSKTKYPTEDRTITGYRASAAVAQFSRELGIAMYGGKRPYGYAFGGSGGGYKTISFSESTTGIWDGTVPFVIGTPMTIPGVFTVQAHALRILGDKVKSIVDAIEPGGSGDMYAGLNKEEGDALREMLCLGFPPQTLYTYQRVGYGLGYGALGGLIDDMVKLDPRYYTEDFWNAPGYLGASSAESLKRARIQRRTTISRIVMSDEARELGLTVTFAAIGTNVIPAALKLESTPTQQLKGANVILKSGGASGQSLNVLDMESGFVVLDIGPYAFSHLKDIKVGDEVLVDNSIYLAAQTYHRHQVPSAEYYAWDQFRAPDGQPICPQREKLIGSWFPERASGSVQSGRYSGKMIVVQSMMDEYAYPWGADWYRSRVKESLGARTNDNFRLWFTDHALHSAPPTKREETHAVSYHGMLEQALRDLSAWVERGVSPPTSTSYKVVDSQILLPAKAAERRGIQPVVELSVQGGKRAETSVGSPVIFIGVIEAPPDTGKIIRAEWDLEGRGDYPVKGEIRHIDASGSKANITMTYTFSKPGTYFPALRVASQRQPDATPYAQVLNLDRVRVVVK
jgi:hypothetical protein